MPDANPPPEPKPPLESGAADPFEDLLVGALERWENEGVAGAESFLAEHPEHAPRLRTHLERLQRIGLTESEAAAANAPADHPARLGEFRILEVLGGGAMGVVYRAMQDSLGREVALKVVRPDQLLFPGTRERFRREIELVARMQHPGIVPIYAVGNDGGVPYFAMELVRGASLAEVITELAAEPPSRLDGAAFDRAIAKCSCDSEQRAPAVLYAGGWVQAVLRVVREVAEALEHAHRRGVLHRDLKPSNVMLTRDGRVLLLDFGLAGGDGVERLTRTGSPLGSLAYLPPELLSDNPPVRDARCDVYSLGVTCWELLALRLPYQSSDPVRLVAMAGRGARPRLASLNAAVAWDAETVIAAAMDSDPARRYASASLFSRDLDNLLANRAIEAREPGAWLRLRRWTQRHPARAVGAAAAFLLFCVAPTVFLVQQRLASDSIRAALGNARLERDRAREAVEVLLTKVAAEDLLHAPRLQRFRRDLLVSARSFYDRFLQDSRGDPQLLADAAHAAQQLADLDAELGDVTAARAAAEQAVAMARELVTRGGSPARLAEALHGLGRLQLSAGQYEAALAPLTEARECWRAVHAGADPGESAAIELMAVERSVAFACNRLERVDDAAACFRAVATMWGELDERTLGTKAWGDAFEHALGAAADEAQMHMERRRFDAARDALADSEALVELFDPDRASSMGAVAAARLRWALGCLQAADGDHEAAEATLRAALDRVAPVREVNSEHANALRVEAAIYNRLSLLLAKAPARRTDAYEATAASADRLRRLIAVDATVANSRVNLATTLGNLGAMQQTDGKLREALATFDEAKSHLDAAVAAAPDVDFSENLFRLTWFRAQVCGALGQAAPTIAGARAVAAMKPEEARFQRIAAGLCATAAAAAANDAALAVDERKRLRGEAEALGFELLRRAAKLGCTDLEWLRSGAEFAPLRSLEGYAEILKDIEANVERSKAAGATSK